MSVGLLIISHDNLGQVLLDVAVAAIGANPMNTDVVAVDNACDPQKLATQVLIKAEQLDQGQGVLVLTDLYGSTPSNVACVLLERDNSAVVSGVNLPMLLRVLNYPGLSLEELVEKAVSGGREGIMDCRSHDF